MTQLKINRIVRMVNALFLMLPCMAYGQSWEWEELPSLPEDASELRDFYTGHHDGVVIVAGGLSDVTTEAGAIFSNSIYVLEPDAEEWRISGTFPTSKSVETSVSNTDGMWIIDEFANKLSWSGENVEFDFFDLISVSITDIALGSTLSEDAAYIAGSSDNESIFWRINLDDDAHRSKRLLEPNPGPLVRYPIMASINDQIYHLGGEVLTDDRVRYTKDAWRFTHEGGWESIASMPYPLRRDARGMAQGPNHVTVFGGVGDDGSYVVQSYHVITDTWTVDEASAMPPPGASLVMDGQPIVFSSALDRGDDGRLRVFRGTYVPAKHGLGWLDYAMLVLYFGVLVYMGYYFSHREDSTEAFFLGHRRVPWWAVGISIFGTSLSAITYISIPATAYATNWVTMLNNMGIVLLAPFIAIWYMPRLREHPVTTAYEYLEKRFNLGTRIYGSIVFITFQIGRMSIVLYLPAIALSAATGMDIRFCILAMGLLATLYTVMGGIEAVIWTDVIQSVVLVSGAVLALILIVFNTDGGVSGLFSEAVNADKMHMINWSGDYTTAALWVVILGGVFGNAYPGMADQTVVQRYLSTADAKEATKALWTNALLTIPIQFLFFGIGTALWLYYRQHPAQLDPQLQNDAILPLFVIQQFPAGLKGVLIAGLFAASMSSLDSSMNSLSSVLVNDYYRRFVRNVTEKGALRAAKGLTLLFGLFGTLSALYVTTFDAPLLFELFLKFLGLVGGGLAGIFVLGTFTKRANGVGALTGAIVSGFVMYYVRQSDIHFFIHGMIGFLTSFVVGYAVSLVTGMGGRKPEADVPV